MPGNASAPNLPDLIGEGEKFCRLRVAEFMGKRIRQTYTQHECVQPGFYSLATQPSQFSRARKFPGSYLKSLGAQQFAPGKGRRARVAKCKFGNAKRTKNVNQSPPFFHRKRFPASRRNNSSVPLSPAIPFSRQKQIPGNVWPDTCESTRAVASRHPGEPRQLAEPPP